MDPMDFPRIKRRTRQAIRGIHRALGSGGQTDIREVG
jgi:hypothetical protein